MMFGVLNPEKIMDVFGTQCITTAKPRIRETPYHSPGSLKSFLMPKMSVKFQPDHPQRGRQLEVG